MDNGIGRPPPFKSPFVDYSDFLPALQDESSSRRAGLLANIHGLVVGERPPGPFHELRAHDFEAETQGCNLMSPRELPGLDAGRYGPAAI
jgi:hypothetical protein